MGKGDTMTMHTDTKIRTPQTKQKPDLVHDDVGQSVVTTTACSLGLKQIIKQILVSSGTCMSV